MNSLGRDITVGIMFIVGIFGFLNGSFIVSTIVFAMSAVFSNLHLNAQRAEIPENI
jgi:CheY-specific phosphatase CheX